MSENTSKIKTLLKSITDFLSEKEEVVIEKLVRHTLEDGLIIEAKEFAKGNLVNIVGPDGLIPLPIGEYKYIKDHVLVVEIPGIIADIIAADVDIVEYATAEALSEFVASHKAEMEEIKQLLTDKLEKLTSEKEELQEQIAETVDAEVIVSKPTNLSESAEPLDKKGELLKLLRTEKQE